MSTATQPLNTTRLEVYTPDTQRQPPRQRITNSTETNKK